MKKVEKSDWTTLLIALSDNINFQNRGVVNRMSLPEILKATQQKIGSDQENTFMINEADQEISAEVGNEWDELVLDDLDPEDRSEFRELKEAIDAKRAETFQEHWAIIRKSMTATRRRGRPKKEGEEERKVKVKGNNVKVKRKWLKRRRARKPLEDEEELKPKKQKNLRSHQISLKMKMFLSCLKQIIIMQHRRWQCQRLRTFCSHHQMRLLQVAWRQ